MDRRQFVAGSTAAIATLGSIPVIAQETYPSRTVTLINPFPPGGAADVVGRPFAAVLEPIVKQPVVIETKAGAAGAVGWDDSGRHTAAGLAVDVVDTTGAGDSFDAGFLAAMLDGLPFAACLRHAAVAGSLSTRAAGGTAAQATRAELSGLV